jgi:hypothetical protein
MISSSCCRKAAKSMSSPAASATAAATIASTMRLISRRGFRSTGRVAVGGLGYGNVQDRMLAREHLYHHTDEPHTVSIIGELMNQINQHVRQPISLSWFRKGDSSRTFGFDLLTQPFVHNN